MKSFNLIKYIIDYLVSRSMVGTKLSIQAAHEQINPSELLKDAIYLDKKEIERCWTSDHYMPWWNTGASGGAAWPWMGAALAKTTKLVIGYRSNSSYTTISSCNSGTSLCNLSLYVSK